ncbi:MAG: helix-turn-helix domain-containing protein [Methanoregula sp.]|jgi:DNA-binding MarR family transcriptional regulator
MKPLTPSQKKVLDAVQLQRDCVFKEICDRAGLSPRTVRYCLDVLEAYGLIRSRHNFRDMRSLVYSSQPP